MVDPPLSTGMSPSGAGASDIVAFAHDLAIEGCLLVGHSMGAFLAMAAAIEEPGLFAALVLVTPAAVKGQPTDEMADGFMAARRDADLMNEHFAPLFVSPPSAERLAMMREAALQLPDAVAERWIREEWPDSDISAGLTGIASPSLVLLGGRDAVVPPERQIEAAMQLADAKIVIRTTEGHMLPVEEPDFCVDEIERFVGALATDRL